MLLDLHEIYICTHDILITFQYCLCSTAMKHPPNSYGGSKSDQCTTSCFGSTNNASTFYLYEPSLLVRVDRPAL